MDRRLHPRLGAALVKALTKPDELALSLLERSKDGTPRVVLENLFGLVLTPGRSSCGT